MNTKWRLSSRAVAAALFFIMAYPALAAEPATLPSFTASEPSVSLGSEAGGWEPAPVTDAPLLAGIPDGKARKTAHVGATALTVCGALLVAGGLATVSAGVSDGMNDETMHRGALMIVSGGVLSALFAVAMRATGSTSPE